MFNKTKKEIGSVVVESAKETFIKMVNDKKYPYVTEVTIVEENSDPYIYVKKSKTRLEASNVTDLIFQAIEIEGLDRSKFTVEYTVTKNGEYVDSEPPTLVYTNIVRTKEPSKYIMWNDKKPHIFSIDREHSELIFEF